MMNKLNALKYCWVLALTPLLTNCGSDEDPVVDPATLTISISASTVAEGGGTVPVTFSLDRASDESVTFSISLAGTATRESDYMFPPTVTINAGNRSANVDLGITDDDEVEDTETIEISISSSDLPEGVALGSASSVIVSIEDNDTNSDNGATLSISANSQSVSEADGTVRIDVTLSEALDSDYSVRYTFDGTATIDEDYTFFNSATVVAGSTGGSFDLTIIDDTAEEGTESIEISFNTVDLPQGVTLGTPSSATISVTDNDGTITCSNDNSTDTNNFECTTTASVDSEYSESVANDVRSITTNGVPDHQYRIQIPNLVSTINSETKDYTVDATPSAGSATTDIADGGQPQWAFGVALNGVKIDPAPAEPFIFETPDGEYVWEWIFEPNTNMEAVGLDCAIAHFQPDGQYHYHGDMGVYADQLLDGLGAGTTTPTTPVQIGWAADGYPIVYKYGPNADGNLVELAPGYRIKEGQRPGDGESAPCGEYNGKYTADYEFAEGVGDLDACNGIAQSITLDGETFDYFYVITNDFPVISRCFTGAPDRSFRLGGG